MATQLQIRRGTTAQMTAFTGAEGEIAVNTSTDTVHVHDGSTAGGFALAKADGSNIGTYAGSFTTLAASGASTLTGAVGINIAPTSYKLTVNSGATTETTAAAIGYNGDVGTNLYINTDHGNNLVSLYASGSASKAMRFLSGTLEVMRLGTTGNVGVGTGANAISHQLVSYKSGANANYVQIASGSTGLGATNGLRLGVSSAGIGEIYSQSASPVMTFNANNVGIGTSIPYNNSKLDVLGSIISTSQTIGTYAANNAGFDFAAATKVGRFFSTSSDATGGHMTFITGAGGGTEKMRLTAAGSVGIGTSTPDTTLHLQTPSGTKSEINFAQTAVTNYRIGVPASTDALVFTYGASTERARLDASGNVLVGRTARLTGQSESISSDTVVSVHGFLAQHQTNAGILQYNSNVFSLRAYGASAGTGAIAFNTGGGGGGADAERMRIAASGATTVTADTTSDWALSVSNGTNSNAFGLYVNAPSTSGIPLRIDGGGSERMRLTAAGKLIVNGTIAGYSGTGITIGSPSAGSSGLSILSTTTGYGYLLFGDTTGDATGGYSGQINYSHGTNRMGFNTNNSERFAIDGSGNAMVGTTTQYFARFSVQGETFQNAVTVRVGTNGYPAINFQNTSAQQQGYIVTNASSVQYISISDKRAKENIADADDAGSKIDSIQVRKFDWIADGSHQDYGMIAQELQAVAPEAVSGDPDSENMMGVDYSKLVPMLVKEIQSLRTRVQELENN